MRLTAPALVLVLFIACGGGSTNDSGGASSQKCESACQRLAACNVANDICAPGGCATWTERWRPEFSDAYFGCLLDPQTPCTSAGSESCAVQASAAVPARQSDRDYSAACLQKRSDCANNPFPDDFCLTTFLSDAWLATAQACLTKSCAEVGACVKAIFKP